MASNIVILKRHRMLISRETHFTWNYKSVSCEIMVGYGQA